MYRPPKIRSKNRRLFCPCTLILVAKYASIQGGGGAGDARVPLRYVVLIKITIDGALVLVQGGELIKMSSFVMTRAQLAGVCLRPEFA